MKKIEMNEHVYTWLMQAVKNHEIWVKKINEIGEEFDDGILRPGEEIEKINNEYDRTLKDLGNIAYIILNK